MTTIHALAWAALVMYVAYGVAFYGEGLKPQGSVGTKVLGGLAEVLLLAVLFYAISS